MFRPRRIVGRAKGRLVRRSPPSGDPPTHEASAGRHLSPPKLLSEGGRQMRRCPPRRAWRRARRAAPEQHRNGAQAALPALRLDVTGTCSRIKYLPVPLCFRSSCQRLPRCITNFGSGARASTHTASVASTPPQYAVDGNNPPSPRDQSVSGGPRPEPQVSVSSRAKCHFGDAHHRKLLRSFRAANHHATTPLVCATIVESARHDAGCQSCSATHVLTSSPIFSILVVIVWPGRR
jgi:hypothetical protein